MQQQKLKLIDGKNKFEKHARRLIHCIFAPFVVLPQYVDDKVPEGMKTQIIFERFLHLGKDFHKEYIEEGTDTEALLYVSKVSLMFPLDNDWYNIFMHLFKKYCIAVKVDYSNIIQIQEFRELDSIEQWELTKLKRWIYKVQKEHLKDKEMIKKKEEKENV